MVTSSALLSPVENKRLAHEIDKLTTVLYSPLRQVPSTRPKKNLSY